MFVVLGNKCLGVVLISLLITQVSQENNSDTNLLIFFKMLKTTKD